MSIETLTVLLTLKRHGRMGRYSISSMTGLGEGVVRRILNELRDQGAIRSLKGGAELTSKGEELLLRLLSDYGISQIDEGNDFAKLFNCECRKCYMSVIRKDINEGDVVRLRDIAIKNGADAALFLRYECSGNKFLILRLEKYLEDWDPGLGALLRSRFININCNDPVVVVCGPNDYQVLKSLTSILKA
ncbi:MAG: hypothetical protein ACP5GY_03935 [Vulcanisaeta sp.]